MAITATKSINGTLYAVSYYVFVKPIADGSYFIRNKALANYVQIDDNADDYSSSGEILELWDFDGADYQRWVFTHLSDGYYKIISSESGLAITVQSQYQDEDEKPLVQTSYVGSDNQQWKITVTQTGSYVIRPKSAEALDTDWCMSAGWTMGGDNGLKVEQRAYTNNTDYKDEWILYGFKDFPYKLLALNENDISRNSYFAEVSPIIENNLDGLIYTHFYHALPLEDTKTMLTDSDIFIIHTHGTQSGFQIAPSQFFTMSDAAQMNLDNLRFALLLTCNTAINFSESHILNNSPVNIIEQMVCSGAETVVGFSEITFVSDCNQFAYDFMEATVQRGQTISMAIQNINYEHYVKNMGNIARIAGNNALILNAE